MAKFIHDGACKLYYDNAEGLSVESSRVDIKQRVKINNDAPNSGDGMAIGQWDGSNHRIESDSSRPMYLTAYNSSGIKMGVSGGVTATVIAAGLTFNGDTAAANSLSDYEEGTWTPAPVLTHNPGGRSITSTNNIQGSYTKIGNLVHVEFRCGWVLDGSGSFNMGVNGLPFTTESTVPANSGVARSNTDGNLFICENVGGSTGSQIGVLRKYDNTGPQASDNLTGHCVYQAT